MVNRQRESAALIAGGMGEHLIVARAITFLSAIYPTAVSVLSEYVDNALDAGANRVWVVVERDRILITDNGHGMVPGFVESDEDTIKMFFEDIENNRMTADFDIKELLSRASLCSLRWMMENIAFSPRLLLASATDAEQAVRGMRGVGSLAFLQIATNGAFVTKPRKDLAEEYWGKGLQEDAIPLLVAVPPTEAQLNNFDTSYGIYDDLTLLRQTRSIEVGSLCDPEGNVLQHGTRVEITGLRGGRELSLRPHLIVEHLRSRFSVELARRRDLEIVVIDKVSVQGRRVSEGVIIKVEPSPIKGIEILNKTYATKEGHPFEVRIHWVVDGRTESIGLVRQGDVIGGLEALPDFARSPWNSGKLAGYVEFPRIPPAQDESHWSTDKQTLLDSPLRTEWRQMLWQLEGELNKAIGAVERTTQQNDLRELQRTIGSAVQESMQQTDVFSGITYATGQQSGSGRSRGPSAPPTTIEAWVLNEHNQGVEDVRVEVTQGTRGFGNKVTGKTGHLSFGRPTRVGEYRVRIFVPTNAVADGQTAYQFRYPHTQGIRAVFRLQTGAPTPQQRLRNNLTVWFEHFSNPDELYSLDYMASGRLRINLGETEMSNAIQTGDVEERNRLACLYVAMAIAEHYLPGEDPGTLFFRASRLFSLIRRNFQSRAVMPVRRRRS